MQVREREWTTGFGPAFEWPFIESLLGTEIVHGTRDRQVFRSILIVIDLGWALRITIRIRSLRFIESGAESNIDRGVWGR